MNTISKSLLALMLFSSLSWTAKAEGTAPWLNISGDVNFDTTGSKTSEYEASLRADASLRFEVIMREGVKAVVKARIEQVLAENGHSVESQSIELEKMLEEAYISVETDKISGLPRAIITVGKQQMAFGQALSELPMFRDNLLYNLSAEREMIGLTVTLPTQFFNMIDSVAMSIYENGAGDFKVAKDKTVSIQVTKAITERLKVQASALVKEHAAQTDKELRGSLGFVFSSADGSYKVWAEGLVFDNNPALANTRVGGQIGASQKMGAGTVVVEYSYLQKHAHELAVAYNLSVNSWLVLAPEVRYTRDITGQGQDDTRIGVQARIQFATDNQKSLRTRR